MNSVIGMPVFDAAVLLLGAARVSYSLTSDSIFRPLREAVWRESSPENAVDTDGRPWRMLYAFKSTSDERKHFGAKKWDYEFRPQEPRDIGFFGGLCECFYCVSWWMAQVALLGWILFGEAATLVALPFAAWFVVNMAAKWLK